MRAPEETSALRFPPFGDARYLGSPNSTPTDDFHYQKPISPAADALGFGSALMSTGRACEERRRPQREQGAAGSQRLVEPVSCGERRAGAQP